MNLLKGLALFVLAAVVFLPVGPVEFLLWDDQIHLTQNPFFAPFNWRSLLDIWTTPYPEGPALYIPISYSVWGLLSLLSQNLTDAWPFLGANFLLHLVNAFLVYTLLRKTLPSLKKEALLFGCLLFFFHPLQVESVVWISGLRDLLWVTFALLSLLAYLCGNYLGVFTALLLALLCKPVAVVTPLLILGLEMISPKEKNRRRFLYLAALFLVSVPFIFLTKVLQPDALVQNIPSWLERPLIALDAMGFYLKKTFLPISLGPDYGRRPDVVLAHFPTYELALAVLFTGLLFWLGKSHKELRRTIAFACLWLVTPLLPVLGIIPFQFQNFSTVADRYMYLPLAGVGILGAVLYSKVPRAKWFLIALLPVLMLTSHFNSRYWRNNFDFFTHALQINPDSKSAGNNLGLILTEKNQLREALPYFEHVYEIYPDNFAAANNIGIIFIRLGEHDKALKHFENNLKVFPKNTDARISYGELLMQMNRDEEALHQLKLATELMPSNGYGEFMYSQILWKTGKKEEALAHLQRAIEIEPFNQDFKTRLENFKILLQTN